MSAQPVVRSLRPAGQLVRQAGPSEATRTLRVVSAAEVRPSVLQYERLEMQSWAPWLRFSRTVLAAQVRYFPEDQFFAYDGDGLLGALSTNRIWWDGDPGTLQSWDAIAGAHKDYRDTHDADGNTLVTLSISIAPRARGGGVATRLLEAVRSSACERGLDHVIGSYRPSGYGRFKLRSADGFLAYVDQRRDDGLPLDPWLRTLTRTGMERRGLDERAMVVEATLAEFEVFRRVSAAWARTPVARDALLHEPALPVPVDECEYWEAAEAGTWYVHRASARAVYVESGVWGTVRLDGPEAQA